MEILADYHTHTVYSHGKGSIEDNVKVAISKGIKKIGISDHGYKNVAYGVKIDDFEKIRANSHFPRPAGPHFPASQGHIKRSALEIGRARGAPPC